MPVHLLDQIASLLGLGGQWSARARGCSLFANGASAEQACLAAVRLRDGAGDNTDLF